MALGEQAKERLAGDLGRRVLHRHADGADGDRALAMAARLLIAVIVVAQALWRVGLLPAHSFSRLSDSASMRREGKRSRIKLPWP